MNNKQSLSIIIQSSSNQWIIDQDDQSVNTKIAAECPRPLRDIAFPPAFVGDLRNTPTLVVSYTEITVVMKHGRRVCVHAFKDDASRSKNITKFGESVLLFLILNAVVLVSGEWPPKAYFPFPHVFLTVAHIHTRVLCVCQILMHSYLENILSVTFCAGMKWGARCCEKKHLINVIAEKQTQTAENHWQAKTWE